MDNRRNRFPKIKELYPYLVAIAVFVLLTIIYVNPILEGKQLYQPDIVNYKGMAKEITDYREATGEEALWTNSMFGGMPAYQISVQWAYNVANFFHKVLTLGFPRPAVPSSREPGCRALRARASHKRPSTPDAATAQRP